MNIFSTVMGNALSKKPNKKQELTNEFLLIDCSQDIAINNRPKELINNECYVRCGAEFILQKPTDLLDYVCEHHLFIQCGFALSRDIAGSLLKFIEQSSLDLLHITSYNINDAMMIMRNLQFIRIKTIKFYVKMLVNHINCVEDYIAIDHEISELMQYYLSYYEVSEIIFQMKFRGDAVIYELSRDALFQI